MSTHFDVIIAGGGPAGSTAATLLAQYGHAVLLLERDTHPRFHIGESMMPHIDPIMMRMGMDWETGNLPKTGGDFIDEANGKIVSFDLTGKYRTFQIERAGFDAKLFAFAAKQGVQTRQSEKVTDVECQPNKVTVNTSQQQYTGRYFIDATGRGALMGRKHRSIRTIKNLGRFALYKYYRNVATQASERLFVLGNVQVLLVSIGWIWLIPLTHNRLSIGLVVKNDIQRGINNENLFQTHLHRSPLVMDLLEGAEAIGPLKAEADFSYINHKRYGMRYGCCGDAAGFLDPIFSSGVFLAIKGAETVADRLHQALKLGNEADTDLHLLNARDFDRGFQTMHLMIDRFYRSGLMYNLFFESARGNAIKQEVTAILAGDLWRKNNKFQQSLLRSRKKIESFI